MPQPIGTIGYICTTQICYEPFLMSMIQIVKYNATNGLNVLYGGSTRGDQAHARNILAENMAGDWLLMLDTDMKFPPNVFERMLKIATENNIEVLGGVYCMRTPPFRPLAFALEGNDFHFVDIRAIDGNLIKLDGAGMGCMLIKRSVFEKIHNELEEEPFRIDFPLNEDFSFFKRLNKLMIPLYLTTQVQAEHLSLQEISYNTYLDFNKEG